MPPTRHNASGPDPSYGIHTPLSVPSGSLIGGSPFKLTCTAITGFRYRQYRDDPYSRAKS